MDDVRLRHKRHGVWDDCKKDIRWLLNMLKEKAMRSTIKMAKRLIWIFLLAYLVIFMKGWVSSNIKFLRYNRIVCEWHNDSRNQVDSRRDKSIKMSVDDTDKQRMTKQLDCSMADNDSYKRRMVERGVVTMNTTKIDGGDRRRMVERRDAAIKITTDDDCDSLTKNKTVHDTDKVRMTERLCVAIKKCKEYAMKPTIRNTKIQGYAWVYPQKNLSYCVTPKVGCTFWKRVLRFLAGDFNSSTNVTRPVHIDRMEVHYSKLKNIQEKHLGDPVNRMFVSQNHMNTFMFSRDPYSRLWSSYIDKIFLPDFWRTESPSIVKKLRKGATKTQKVCGHDVSFGEFIAFVIHTLSHGEDLNEHFSPIYKLCNPCQMRFDVLGKLETFEMDSKYIFNNFDLNELSDKVSYSRNVENEVNVLIKYNFDLERRVIPRCFNRTLVTQRLWKAFQMNGYISRNTTMPVAFVQNISSSRDFGHRFQDLVQKTIKMVGSVVLKKQKREFLVQAYRQVPLADLMAIPKLFKPDFELFGYEKYPRDIFPEGKDQ